MNLRHMGIWQHSRCTWRVPQRGGSVDGGLLRRGQTPGGKHVAPSAMSLRVLFSTLLFLFFFFTRSLSLFPHTRRCASMSKHYSNSSSQDSSSDLELGLALTLSPYAIATAPSQVVGWPPLGAYRMNSYNSHAKSPAAEVFDSTVDKRTSNSTGVRKSADGGSDSNNIISKEKANLRSSLFVKVKMDGIPIGRKVDLSAHGSYETLAQTLEDMFDESTTVLTHKGSNREEHGTIVGADGHLKLLDGSSNFVLTYEDKEGDWMLVGDVPWWMFLNSVRRLRIMRTPEANGLAP